MLVCAVGWVLAVNCLWFFIPRGVFDGLGTRTTRRDVGIRALARSLARSLTIMFDNANSTWLPRSFPRTDASIRLSHPFTQPARRRTYCISEQEEQEEQSKRTADPSTHSQRSLISPPSLVSPPPAPSFLSLPSTNQDSIDATTDKRVLGWLQGVRRLLGDGAAADRGVRPRKIGGADGAAGALSNAVGERPKMQRA